MKDSEFEATKERIRIIRDFWAEKLGLLWWTVHYNYRDDSAYFQEPNGVQAAARCRPEWRYLEASIDLNMPQLFGMDDDELEKIIVHEMMHILLHEMRNFDEEAGLKHEERVATTFTKAFLWVRDFLTPAPPPEGLTELH